MMLSREGSFMMMYLVALFYGDSVFLTSGDLLSSSSGECPLTHSWGTATCPPPMCALLISENSFFILGNMSFSGFEVLELRKEMHFH